MSRSTTSSSAPESYARRLLAELSDIHAAFAEILSASEIVNVDPNRRGSGILVIGHATWGWAPSPYALEAGRMALLRRVRDWEPQYRLLFPHPTPMVRERLDTSFDLLESWLVRVSGAHDVPPAMDEAVRYLTETVDGLGDLINLLPSDEYATRLAVDTNTLIDNPDLAVHVGTLGARYMVHLFPVVLREIDDLKRGGKSQDLREAAGHAERRLKGLRDHGNVQAGVRVAGDVWAVFEHVEHALLEELAALVWAANMAALELHVPQWRVGSGRPAGRGMPDRLVFDLDPGQGTSIVECCRVAERLRDVLLDDGLTPYAKTSGSKGMQLYCGISTADPAAPSAYAKRLAQQLARETPERVTAVVAKAQRTGRVFIDWSQNNPAKTTVAPYSLRGRDHPTVSTPITWDEVRACRRATQLVFTADDVLDRVDQLGDLLARLDDTKAPLPAG